MPDYDKVIGIFTPPLVEAQRKYARDLLTHTNAYRKVRYAEAFEVCEYGRQPNKVELKQLFPLLP